MRSRALKRASLVIALSAAAVFGGVSVAGATPSPNGPGQPGVLSTGSGGTACGDANASNQPPGFGTDGFAHASLVYAGSPQNPTAANGSPTIAQYDIACFQVSSNPGHN
jgi:hypothetical protein